MKTMRTEPQIITRNGKAVSVIVPIERYEELLERAEDASDLKWLKRARAGKLRYRPLEDYLSERKAKARA
jgi:prevent-host-death family protein